MTLWAAVIAVALGSFLLKAAGPAILGDRDLPPSSKGVIALLAPTLLAALVAVEVLGRRWDGVDPAMLAALAVVAVTRLLLKAPLLVAVLAGVVTAAALRAISG